VKADPTAQLRVLDLQALDTALDQIAHRRRTLPELGELERLEAELRTVTDDVVRAETAVSDLDREQRKIENDVDAVRARADRDRARMESGAVGSPRELESLQSEVVSLARRQGDLEEQVLEVMERREAADAMLSAAAEKQAQLREARADAQQRRDVALADLDQRQGGTAAQREPTAAQIPPDLLALYERIRRSSRGTGAAALLRRQCQGCHLDLAGTDLAAAKAAAPDEVLRCEECSRILVRTAESGL